jgi:hypothetical protein
MKLFRRGGSADDVLVAVAAEQRWQPAPTLGALSMLPPSHKAADIHGLRGPMPPGCGGRAFTGFVVAGVPMTVSHVEVYRTDVDHEIYDVVQWEVPVLASAHLEVLAGADLWNHHRLSDRFGSAGSQSISVTDRQRIRVGRDMSDEFVRIVGTDGPELAEIRRLGGEIRNGFACEVVDRSAAVFTWSAVAHRGVERWSTLLSAAAAFCHLIDRASPTAQ